MPPKLQKDMDEMRRELERLPPALRSLALDKILDSLPPDDDFPPEIQRALMKIILLGEDALDHILDDLPDTPPLPRRARGGRPRGRS